LIETTNWRALTGFGKYDRLLPAHRIKPLEVFETQKAGPAVFAIDEMKNACHGINSVVDCSQACSFCVSGAFRRGTKLMSSSRNLGFADGCGG
jgi:hypothetical protein